MPYVYSFLFKALRRSFWQYFDVIFTYRFDFSRFRSKSWRVKELLDRKGSFWRDGSLSVDLISVGTKLQETRQTFYRTSSTRWLLVKRCSSRLYFAAIWAVTFLFCIHFIPCGRSAALSFSFAIQYSLWNGLDCQLKDRCTALALRAENSIDIRIPREVCTGNAILVQVPWILQR